MLEITTITNRDMEDHQKDVQDVLWEGGLVDPKLITLQNIQKFEDITDAMTLRFEKTFSPGAATWHEHFENNPAWTEGQG